MRPSDPDPDQEPQDTRPSKSARKREMHALQSLGERLAGLSATRQDALPLTEPLRDALRAYARIRPGAHEGRRRQMQLIGKRMRDPALDIASIEAALDTDRAHARAQLVPMQQATHWRDALVTGEVSWQDFATRFPQAPDLAALAGAARDERLNGRPPRQQRLLYRQLQQFFSETGS